MTDPLPIQSATGPLRAAVRPPGSKSITNRALLLAALGDGASRIEHALRSDDTDALVAALRTLGVAIDFDGDAIVVEGCDGRLPRGGSIDLGDGGTPTRFMLAAACLAAGTVEIDGSPRLRERPIADGVDLLRLLGATIEYMEAPGRLPVRVHGGARASGAGAVRGASTGLHGGRVRVGATSSSQFISALMLVAPFLREGLEIEYLSAPTSASYLSLTRAVLRAVGVEVRDSSLVGPRCDRIAATRVRVGAFAVEPDASSAAYWFVASALVPGSRIVVDGLAAGSPQPDIGMLEVLERVGASWTSSRSPRRTIVEGPPRLRPFDLDLGHMPDGAMAAAMLAARAEGPSTLRGLETLRVKETDRIAALATELAKLGCRTTATDHTLRIDPVDAHERPVVIATYNDHRMAMAFAVLGLARRGISIEHPECVGKSYRSFWEDLARVRGVP
ncbi:MAG: 3-phosphoshikimate 1-carboxyvinyltransferase [Phycisphaerales bacterium]